MKKKTIKMLLIIRKKQVLFSIILITNVSPKLIYSRTCHKVIIYHDFQTMEEGTQQI